MDSIPIPIPEKDGIVTPLGPTHATNYILYIVGPPGRVPAVAAATALRSASTVTLIDEAQEFRHKL